MADCIILLFLHEVGILMFSIFIITVPAAKYCNYGLDVSSAESLKNQSCTTRQRYLPSILISTDQNELPIYQDEKFNFNDDEFSRSDNSYVKIYDCYIFRYVAKQKLNDDIQQESVHITFGCDFNSNCRNKDFNEVLTGEVVNGSEGQLFCCDSDNCNKVDRLPHLPAENRVCFHGTNNKSDVQTNMKESCGHPDVMCAKMSVYTPEGITENYFCDNEMLCRYQMSSGSFRSCHASVVDNTTQELCCCDSSMCFDPQWPPYDSTSKLSVGYDSNSNLSILSVVNIETLENPAAAAAKDGLVITGLVIALIFVTSVGGAIIFIMMCRKRRRPRADPNVIMQYERLSATDPDVDGAVFL